MRLSEKIQRTTPYIQIAKEVGVTTRFVGMIARGEREPKRGKGMMVKAKLEALAAENTIKQAQSLNTNN